MKKTLVFFHITREKYCEKHFFNRKSSEEIHSPHKKALNIAVCLNASNFGFSSPLLLYTLNAKCPEMSKNSDRLTTWKTRPAIMTLMPVCCVPLSLAVEAMAPPTAWRIRDTRSKHMNVMVYVRGWKKEICSPNTTTRRDRQR